MIFIALTPTHYFLLFFPRFVCMCVFVAWQLTYFLIAQLFLKSTSTFLLCLSTLRLLHIFFTQLLWTLRHFRSNVQHVRLSDLIYRYSNTLCIVWQHYNPKTYYITLLFNQWRHPTTVVTVCVCVCCVAQQTLFKVMVE